MLAQIITREYEQLEIEAPKNGNFTAEERLQYFKSALHPSSASKNRYPDVMAREDTRVCLRYFPENGSDYINANYILNGQYISCQAPTLPNFSDFWQMVWEQKSGIILMLTRLFENGRTKASIYWPSGNHRTLQFRKILVTLLDEEEYETLTIRRFLLSCEGEIRDVYHLHFTAWPDFGVPSCTKGIRMLVNSVDHYNSQATAHGPMIVHCSAGVGRSGTFIAIHHVFSQIDKGLNFSIYEITRQMRKERTGMVQNEKQYEFIHEAVQDYQALLAAPLLIYQSDDSDNDISAQPVASHDLLRWRRTSSDRLRNVLTVSTS